jgi:hypothetical protein
MSVDPLNPNGGSPADPGRLDASHAARRSSPAIRDDKGDAAPPNQGRTAADRVELSDASRNLVEQAKGAAETPPSGTVSAERLRTVLARIDSKYYDSAAVRDQVAHHVAKDLGPTPTE